MMRIFIADDSAPMRERIKDLLSEVRGVEIVGHARDALEAKRSIPEVKPDVVILDIRMPKGNGIDVLKAIKGAKSVPMVIMLTNYTLLEKPPATPSCPRLTGKQHF